MDADIIDLTRITVLMIVFGAVSAWALTRAYFHRVIAGKDRLLKSEVALFGYELARYRAPAGGPHPILQALSTRESDCADTADALQRIYALREENVRLGVLKRSMRLLDRQWAEQAETKGHEKFTIEQVRATVAAALGSRAASPQPLDVELLGRFIALQTRLGIPPNLDGDATEASFAAQLAALCGAVERILADGRPPIATPTLRTVQDLPGARRAEDLAAGVA